MKKPSMILEIVEGFSVLFRNYVDLIVVLRFEPASL